MKTPLPTSPAPHWVRNCYPLTLGTIYRQGWRVVASKPGWLMLAPFNLSNQK